MREWYVAAQTLEKNDQLDRIAQFGQAAKASAVTLSELDAHRMQADLDEYKQQFDRAGSIVRSAREFMGKAIQAGITNGNPEGGFSIEGKTYRVYQQEDRINVTNMQTGARVSAKGATLVRISGTGCSRC